MYQADSTVPSNLHSLRWPSGAEEKARAYGHPTLSSDSHAATPKTTVRTRRPRPTVSVVIPALNEAGSIGWVMEHIPAWVSEVVLVDGLSDDRTEAIARALCPNLVVVHQHRRGKGAALRAGFAAATGDIVVMIDADGSTDPAEMLGFVEKLEAGADFVKGSRNLDGGGSLDSTPIRHAGNSGFVLLANSLYGSHFTDLCYGYCAFWRGHLDTLALTADGFEIETQLVLNAVKADLSIAEVPSVELERRAGSSNLHAVSDGVRVLRTMVGEWHQELDRDGAERARINLSEVEVAACDSPAWLPAGRDRRRYQSGEAAGPTSRVPDRRERLAHTSTILLVRGCEAEPVVPVPEREAAAEWAPAPGLIPA